MPPRVGGETTLGATLVPWTRGTNIRAQHPGTPKSLKCYRPEDFKNASQTEAKLETGLDDNRILKTAKEMEEFPKSISLTTWLSEVQCELEERGMDTVFRLFDPVTETEHYILTEWGLMQDVDIDRWIQTLSQTGVMQTMQEAAAIALATLNNASTPAGTAIVLPLGTAVVPAAHPVNTSDQYNLAMSAKFLKNSVSLELWDTVQKDLPINAFGPQILYQIITSHQMVSASAIRSLVKTLEHMQLKTEPGENVLTFSDKIFDTASRIEGSGQAPRDLSVIVASRYLGTSTISFELHASQVHNEVDINPNTFTVREIIAKFKSKYRSLHQQGLWEAKSADKTALEVQGLKAEVQDLKLKMNQPPPAGPGHDNNQVTWRKVAPKGNELHEKVCNNKTYKWCGTCKRWSRGNKAHLTSEHVVGFKNKKDDDKDQKPEEDPPNNPTNPSGHLAAGSLQLTSGFLCMPGLKE